MHHFIKLMEYNNCEVVVKNQQNKTPRRLSCVQCLYRVERIFSVFLQFHFDIAVYHEVRSSDSVASAIMLLM